MRTGAVECSCCGYLLEFRGQVILVCPACGTRNTLPDERVENLPSFRNARELQLRGEFCDAEASYQRVLDEVPDDADALWGRLLCHYGAKLEVDCTGERRFTLRLPRSKPLRAQGDFARACECAPPLMRQQYEQDAAYIDGAMEAIRRQTAHMQPYDVFICHKTTMLEGEGLTRDYERGRDLHDLLTRAGYRAFFAPTDMAGVSAGESYEAGIYHAIHTAKVMLVVCSDTQYLHATWVRSEWERFLSRRDEGENVALIPLLFGGMRATQLPRAFDMRHLQAIEMEINGTDTLLARLRQLIPREQDDKLLVNDNKGKHGSWKTALLMLLLLAIVGGSVYALSHVRRGDLEDGMMTGKFQSPMSTPTHTPIHTPTVYATQEKTAEPTLDLDSMLNKAIPTPSPTLTVTSTAKSMQNMPESTHDFASVEWQYMYAGEVPNNDRETFARTENIRFRFAIIGPLPSSKTRIRWRVVATEADKVLEADYAIHLADGSCQATCKRLPSGRYEFEVYYIHQQVTQVIGRKCFTIE